MDESTNKKKAEIKNWIRSLALAIIVAMVVNKGIIVNAVVPTPSMEKTIMVKDRLIANRLAYVFKEPERGDIIVFVSLEDDSKLYVKRLVGLPGEEVNIVDGKVYIDDILLNEEYLNEEPFEGDYGPFLVPEEHYFFLGDNRNHSHDARMWENPFISMDEVVGKALFSYYPRFKILCANGDR